MSELANVGLVGLQRAEFARASKAQTRATFAQYVVGLVGIVAPFSSDRFIDYGLAGLSLAGVLATFYFDNEHRAVRTYAGRVRRATVVSDGLGEPLPASEDLDIRRCFGGDVEDAKRRDDPAYFASTKVGGWARFVDHISESAFWTHDLFEQSARRSFLSSGAYFAIAATLLYIVIAFASADQIRVATQTFCAALVLAVSREQLGSALAYHFGARRVRDVVQRLNQAPPTQGEAMLIWGDYNAALDDTPLVPPSVYESRKAIINSLWQSRMTTVTR